MDNERDCNLFFRSRGDGTYEQLGLQDCAQHGRGVTLMDADGSGGGSICTVATPSSMPSLGSAVANLGAAGLFSVVGHAMYSSKSFEEELAFYGTYHQNPWNQLIHFIFIPAIWYTICLMTCYIDFLPLSLLGLDRLPGGKGGKGGKGHRVTWGTLMPLLYGAFYVSLEPATGGLFAALLCLMYAQASGAVAAERAFNEAARAKGKAAKHSWFRFAFALHALSWYMQIHPGHGMLEGVKPALVDSLGQALGVAPFFAGLEGMWFLGGAPELHKRVLLLVAENTAAMCAAGTLPASSCVAR